MSTERSEHEPGEREKRISIIGRIKSWPVIQALVAAREGARTERTGPYRAMGVAGNTDEDR